MKLSLYACLIALLMCLFVGNLSSQVLIDMAIYNAPINSSTLEIRLRPTADVLPLPLRNFSAGVVTVRFPSALNGTLSVISSTYGYSIAVVGLNQGGYDYYALQFFGTNFVSWLSGQEYVAAVLQFSNGPATGGFELTTGVTWTNNENANFYVELDGVPRQGIFYTPVCTLPDVPTVSATTCTGGSRTISVTGGNLNDATAWHWYTGSCGGVPVGTGASLNVSPINTTTYYVRGEGGCVPPGACGQVTVTSCPLEFSGTIKWEHDGTSGVKDATVYVTGASSGSGISDIDGNYLVSVPYATGNFTVKPVKNINRMNGVTVADVTAIQQHLTNINPITNPYKLVAADINRSNSVSTFDASVLNQCLLNNPTALAQFSVFWRFMPQSHNLALPPWGFPEQINLTGISTNQTGLNFKGVKIGDVVSTWANPANFGAGEPLVLRVQDRELHAGEPVEAEFRADQLNDLIALQFALRFDPSMLQFEGLETLDGLPLSMDNFGLYQVSEGEIRVVWAQEKSAALAEAAPVFRLRCTALQSGARLSEVLTLDTAEDTDLPARVYNSAFAESGVELHFTEASGTSGNPGWEPLLHALPNPFSERVTIGFTLPEATEAQLRIFSTEGRELWRLDKYYPAGHHRETVRMEDLNASGVLFYELTTPLGKATKKLAAIRL